MNAVTVEHYISALAIQAEIEAMKIENIHCERGGHAPAYGDGSFFQKANELANLSASLHEVRMNGMTEIEKG